LPTVNYNGDKVYFPNTVTSEEIQDVLGAMTASAKAVGEFALVMGSASIAEPISGLAGIGTSIYTGKLDAGVDAIAKVQDALTYQPRTRAGQVAMRSIAKDVSNLAEVTGLNTLSGYWRDRVVPALQDNLGAVSGSVLAAGGLGLITAMSEFVPGSRATRAMPFPQEGAFKYFDADLNPSPKDVSFRGGHTAPVRDGYSAPLHDLAGSGLYPADIYDKKTQARYYGSAQSDIDNETFDAINATKGNPDAEVTIYRAVPKDSPSDINSGDWVTTSKSYAEQHGDFDDDWQILSAKVKAGDLFTDGNSAHEYGWNPAQTFDPSTADISHLSKTDSIRYESAINNENWDRAAELAKNPKITDLPMDNASRMARAKDQGFDTSTPVYHGTELDFDAFDPDRSIGSQFWSTTDKAAIESGNVGAQGKGVIKEMYQRINNPAGWDEYDKFSIDELIDQGYDGLKLPEPDGQSTMVAFDPSQYRSVNATFDPAKRSSSNLLAGTAAATPIAASLLNMQPDDDTQ